MQNDEEGHDTDVKPTLPPTLGGSILAGAPHVLPLKLTASAPPTATQNDADRQDTDARAFVASTVAGRLHEPPSKNAAFPTLWVFPPGDASTAAFPPTAAQNADDGHETDGDESDRSTPVGAVQRLDTDAIAGPANAPARQPSTHTLTPASASNRHAPNHNLLPIQPSTMPASKSFAPDGDQPFPCDPSRDERRAFRNRERVAWRESGNDRRAAAGVTFCVR
jgi:hypothetical protein